MDETQTKPMSFRDTAKGIAVRAGILAVAGVVVSAWVFGLAAKAASGVVKILAALFVLTVGAGVATWKVKRLTGSKGHRFKASSSEPLSLGPL